jgi:hypothetical protein
MHIYTGSLRPQRNITRRSAAALLVRLVGYELPKINLIVIFQTVALVPLGVPNYFPMATANIRGTR